MSFDFDAAVQAPFRMQPGLRRLPEGAAQLTPLAPGSRHQREKLAVLSAFADQHLCAVPGFDAAPALDALCRHAANEHPAAWAWDGERAQALRLSVTVTPAGDVQQLQTGSFGLGDEVGRCLLGLPAAWRLAGLLGLAFAEDFAIVDGPSGTLPWLAVALPSHWAPAAKLGLHFTQVHAPVADNALLLKAGDHLLGLVTGEERWERFVWTITDHPRLHAHPARVDPQRWRHTLTSGASGATDASGAMGRMGATGAWWRTERQTFIPVLQTGQAVFTIHIEVQPLEQAANTPQRAAALHAALATMSPAVLHYRGLQTVRDELLAWLASQVARSA